jgi:large repetitive protein
VTFNAGVLSGTPAQGTAGTYNEIVFTATNGVGTPAVQSFTLSIKSDAPPLVGFNVTNQNPSDGSFTQLPTEGPQQGCPNPLGGCYPEGTVVTLTATPNAGFTFGTWTGFAGCGTSPTCVVTMETQSVVLTLSFAPTPPVVTTPTPSQTGAAGGSFTFPLSATGFSTMPTYTASCSIPAGSCTINGTMLVVTTTARTSMAVHEVTAWVGPSSGGGNGRRGGNGGSAAARAPVVGVAEALLAMLAAMMLVSIASACGATAALRLRRVALAPALATLVVFAGLALLAACGGSGGGTMPTGTPAGTYTVTVTAKAGTQSATTNVSVIVQ